MATLKSLTLVSVGALLAATSVVAVAGPSSSPFASKKKKAWETAQPAPAPAPRQGGATYTPPRTFATQPTQAYQYQAPQTQTYQSPQQAPQQAPQSRSQYQAPTGGAGYQLPSSNYQAPAQTRSQIPSQTRSTAAPQGYYPGKKQSGLQVPQTVPNTLPKPQTYNPYAQARPTQQNAPQQYTPQQYTSAGGAQYNNNGLRGASKPSWSQRFGLGGLETSLSGFAKAGVAAVDRTGASVKAETIVDIDVRGEVSAITDGGLEYGLGARVRAQRDKYRRGFGGRVGDCPVTNAACASTVVGADTRAIKGHTGQFYTDGPSDAKANQIALEGAYLFLRSSYGDVVMGRDDGSAYLFSLGAPTLLAVSASNSGVDYTGLDSVKTYNDASGFAEKIAYTSPRLLGDTVGVGIQLGVSYAPNTRACGVNYCVRENGTGAADVFAPEVKNLIETGLSFDRKFSNGLSAELTGTYAHGSEKTGNAAFTNLSSWGAGLELKYADFVFGTSYLNSNNAIAGDGNYSAYDAGLTWQPSKWGFSASYGHANDKLAQLKSDQGVFGVSYDFDKFRLGTGVQYINRKTPFDTGVAIVRRSDKAVALFVEGGVRF